jgi:hypothetical protein
MGVEKFLRNGTSLKKAKGKNEQKTRGEKVFFTLLSGHNVKGYC